MGAVLGVLGFVWPNPSSPDHVHRIRIQLALVMHARLPRALSRVDVEGPLKTSWLASWPDLVKLKSDAEDLRSALKQIVFELYLQFLRDGLDWSLSYDELKHSKEGKQNELERSGVFVSCYIGDF